MKTKSKIMSDSDSDIEQNLIDAGCDKNFIDCFMAMDTDRQKKEVLAMLARQRILLLDDIHAGERKIYCLDHLVNKLKDNSRTIIR